MTTCTKCATEVDADDLTAVDRHFAQECQTFAAEGYRLGVAFRALGAAMAAEARRLFRHA
jgi:hypothetical protein